MAEVQQTFEKAMTQLAPPWLRRTVGAAVMEGIGSQIESLSLRTAESVKKRFPDALSPDALGYTGRERRILRGPGEDGETFATRLQLWWDSHLLRGGPYALLTQLHQFFLASNNIQIDLVANSGTRHIVGTDGAIARDSITWSGDGQYPAKWARIFLFFNLTGTTVSLPLITESGEEVLTESGEQVLATLSIYSLTASEREIFCAVPREWNAAHIDRIYINLLPPDGELWGYPQPVGTWASNDPSPGQVWGGNEVVQFIC